jgi:TnpA family transposase
MGSQSCCKSCSETLPFRAYDLQPKKLCDSGVLPGVAKLRTYATRQTPMPVTFLTDEQDRRYGRYAGEPSPEQLARFFHLDDADKQLIKRRRGDHMRLGFALQLSTARFLGTFLENPTDVPAGAIMVLARQLNIPDSECLSRYTATKQRWEHTAEIRRHYGYRLFSEPFIQWRLSRWLYALCWTGTDRPSVLFDRATSWLVAGKVLLPGASVVERLIAQVRSRANRRLWRSLTDGISCEQRDRLESILTVPDDNRQSAFDRLRHGPTLQSVPELVRAIARLAEIQNLTCNLPQVDHLPRTRLLSLARYANAVNAQTMSRLSDERRIATVLAFIKVLEASAADDVMDLFDVVLTRTVNDALKERQKTRLRGLRDLDAAALTLRKACAVLLNEEIAARTVKQAVFSKVPKAAIESAITQIDDLTRDPDDLYFEEIVALHRRVQRFLPALASTIPFGSAPAGRPVMNALRHFAAQSGRLKPQNIPVDFAPKAWQKRMKKGLAIDCRVWTVCLVDCLRQALRKRDVFVARSVRYADPRIGLLDGAAWEAARPAVCRSLGLSKSADEEIAKLSAQLDAAYRRVASNLPNNAHVRFEPDGEMVLTGLDKLEEPDSLIALRREVEARLPYVQFPEMLLEIHARTGFVNAFAHVSEAEARAGDLATSICAVLAAEAGNTGLEPFVRADVPALRRHRLSWVRQNYIRAETLTKANARLVAAQNDIELARCWGGGDVASADGLRFVVPVRTIHAGPNPKYYGMERGVTYYNMMSDQSTGLNGIVVPGTLRDSLQLLSVVLEQETDFDPTKIMTDTGAYSDVIFAVFWLLGCQFSPRLADVAGTNFWRIDPDADYGPLNQIATNIVPTKLIRQNWDDFLRLAGSLKLGLVQPGNLMRTLQTNNKPTQLARALQQLGRIVKTNYILPFIDDENERRRVLTQLNRHEGRHRLARDVFHGGRGELRQRYREGQEDQLNALGLVVNVIILWNTIYMNAALEQLRKEGYPVKDEDVARLSPTMSHHINLLGRYSFTLPEPVARGALRPLRTPEDALNEAA